MEPELRLETQLFVFLYYNIMYHGVSFNPPPLDKTPRANIRLRFQKNKTPRKQLVWDFPKIAREAREKKSGFFTVYKGKTLKNGRRRRPKILTTIKPHIQDLKLKFLKK